MKLNLPIVSALAAAALTVSLPAAASAGAPLVVNAVTAVPGSAADPFMALGTVDPNDMLDITASGTVSLQPGPQYYTNAGGVLVSSGSFGSNGNPGDYNNFGMTSPGCPLATCTYGALLATLTLPGGFQQTVQVFNPTTSGAGSSSPPTTLSYDGTFGGLFNLFTSPGAAGGKLTFSIADSFYGDNAGAFSVSAVPEPAAWLLLLGGVGLMGAALRLQRRRNVPLSAV